MVKVMVVLGVAVMVAWRRQQGGGGKERGGGEGDGGGGGGRDDDVGSYGWWLWCRARRSGVAGCNV